MWNLYANQERWLSEMATVVFFHAHPDDEALSTGGTMALMAEAGHRVILVVATRGEEGEPVEGILKDGEKLEDRRSLETEQSGKILGVSRVEFLGYRDSGMIDSSTTAHPECFWQADESAAVSRLTNILKDEKVDLIVVYDPNGGYGHPDHIQVHRVGTKWAEENGVRLRWVTLNRDAIRRVVEEAIKANIEAGQELDSDLAKREERSSDESFGMAESDITHAIDVVSVLDQKRQAVATHASQIASDSFFVTLGNEEYSRAFGKEWYVDPNFPRGAEELLRTDLLLN